MIDGASRAFEGAGRQRCDAGSAQVARLALLEAGTPRGLTVTYLLIALCLGRHFVLSAFSGLDIAESPRDRLGRRGFVNPRRAP